MERLQGNERPTDKMLASYFLKGLTKELKNAVASINIATGFDTLVNAAARVEKQLGMSVTRSRARSGSNFDYEPNLNDVSNAKTSFESDANSDSGLDDDDDEKLTKKSSTKKESSSKKKQKGKRTKKEEELVDKLQSIGYSMLPPREKLYCAICEWEGHTTQNC